MDESTTAVVENATRQESSSSPTKPSSSTSNATPTTEPKTPTASSSSANIEFEPPAACIRRLLKQVLPKSTNVSKDSLSAISRASGIFVLYLTACANDVAREGRRSTIVAKDVLGALKELDFGEFVPLMEKFLEGHRKEERCKKEEKERVKKLQVERQQSLQQQEEKEKAVASSLSYDGEEKEGMRDATTGKFVARDGREEGVV
eukprot:CAMPEP_0201643412 /NCGR_PEP_ID=MMETSP0493-20130528/28141_1 /ASSEMBLY_ACC=CAM_ASM_000838 /TAXON_ID=420259 /ORGANISM="Thalassiosira gravida, Strain GMp14c1" /LENGTH=203 /DNA_ID=CAMNT_0048117827 /DNA_START=37 /DNA_END=645 /DNA_ORIENTATION=-